MSPEKQSALDAMARIRSHLAQALNAAHTEGVGHHPWSESEPIRAAYGPIADALTAFDQIAVEAYGLQNYTETISRLSRRVA